MELNEVLKERRSTREFSNQKVNKEDLYQLLDAARLAPSAGNRQPWLFVVLEGNLKNQVARIMEEHIKNAQITLDGEKNATHAYNPISSVKKSIQIIKEAPVLILVLRKFSEDWKEGDYLSIGCAIENISLRATDLKLGSLIIRDVVYTRDKIATYIGYENMELVTGLAVGYSIEYPYERFKKKIEDIVVCKE